MISRGGRLGKRDVLIAGGLSLLGVLMMLSDVSRAAPADEQVSLVALPLFLAVTAPVAWWRTAPLPALAAVIGALAVHVAVVGTTLRCGVAFPVMFVLVYAAASRLTNPGALLGLALGLAGAVARVRVRPQCAPLCAPVFRGDDCRGMGHWAGGSLPDAAGGGAADANERVARRPRPARQP